MRCNGRKLAAIASAAAAAAAASVYAAIHAESRDHSIKSNQIKFISKCKNSAHSKHVMHLGGTARRIALTAAQCYSFIYK